MEGNHGNTMLIFRCHNLAQTSIAQETVYQSIKDEMDVLCKCDFTIQAPKLICSDEMGVTLRGSIDQIWLTYVEMWVATKATINALGVALTVDGTCPVLLQSLDDPLCEAIGAAKQTSNSSLPVGVAIGVTMVIVLLMGATAVVIIKKKRTSRVHKIA